MVARTAPRASRDPGAHPCAARVRAARCRSLRALPRGGLHQAPSSLQPRGAAQPMRRAHRSVPSTSTSGGATSSGDPSSPYSPSGLPRSVTSRAPGRSSCRCSSESASAPSQPSGAADGLGQGAPSSLISAGRNERPRLPHRNRPSVRLREPPSLASARRPGADPRRGGHGAHPPLGDARPLRSGLRRASRSGRGDVSALPRSRQDRRARKGHPAPSGCSSITHFEMLSRRS